MALRNEVYSRFKTLEPREQRVCRWENSVTSPGRMHDAWCRQGPPLAAGSCGRLLAVQASNAGHLGRERAWPSLAGRPAQACAGLSEAGLVDRKPNADRRRPAEEPGGRSIQSHRQRVGISVVRTTTPQRQHARTCVHPDALWRQLIAAISSQSLSGGALKSVA